MSCPMREHFDDTLEAGGGAGWPRVAASASRARVGVGRELHASTATDGAARAGVLRTAHGEIRTPAFMPVGTKATVKALHPDEVRALGAARHPGQHVPPPLPARRATSSRRSAASTRSPAGAGRSSPTREASRSSRCATRSLALDDDGVTFRSVYDGAEARFTPEGAAEIQRRLGSDIAMCLDVCLPAGAPRRRARARRAASRRTGPSGRSTLRARPGSFASGSRRAGRIAELRRRSIEEITALPFDGYRARRPRGRGVEGRDARLRRLGGAAAPVRHVRATSWESATRSASSRSIARGIDMFDCVLPTRTARTGSALTWEGRLNLRNAALPHRSAAARRGLRLPRLRALLARVHPPPRHAGRDPRAAAAEPA